MASVHAYPTPQRILFQTAAAEGCLFLVGVRILRRRLRQSAWGWRRLVLSTPRQLRASAQIWDEVDDDDADDLLGGIERRTSTSTSRNLLDTFEAGAEFKQAKLFAATRTFAVAPWSEDVEPKPIFAVSDNTGQVAKRLAEAAFMQFGCSYKANIKVVADVRTEHDVHEVVAEAASMAPPGALAIEKSGALIVYTLACPELSAFLRNECDKRGVQCIDALEPLLKAMQKKFGIPRSIYSVDEDQQLRGFESEGLTIFTVSDSTGSSARQMVFAALRQFPGHGVETITLCPDVRSLEEINCVVQEAAVMESLVVFSFASPGMSRFMRQQCERSKVKYVDVYQPVLIAFEKYLDYPPVGVAGGHDLQSDASSFMKWQTLRAPN